MRFLYSESFKRDFQDLPKEVQKIADRKLTLFVKNFRHPSLRVKKIEETQNIWEGSIKKLPFYFFNPYILRRVGRDDILKKGKQK